MKSIIHNSIKIATIASLVLLGACNSLESEPPQLITDDTVTNPEDSSAVYMQGLVAAVYGKLPNYNNRLNSSYLDAATDDGTLTRDPGGFSLEMYRNGSLTPASAASSDGAAFSSYYDGIRKANNFLKLIKGFTPNKDLREEKIIQYKAEVRALRAFFYFELMKRWGGVPIVGDTLYNYTDDWRIPRNSIDEVAKYIEDFLSPQGAQSVYADLLPAAVTFDPNELADCGHFNQGAALALLSRMKLYLASPSFNPTNDVQKWADAADAAKRVMDLGVYDLMPNILEMFAKSDLFPHKEGIFFKEVGSSSSPETTNSPIGYKNGTYNGLTSPSQNLVDAFWDINGKAITDPATVYDPAKPYENRDPRLKFTIFYNGSRWLKRDVQTFEGGLDRPNRPGYFQTQTGYYLRKFLSLDEEKADVSAFSHNVFLIRYAEILLNYAEAVNESDPTNKAAIEDVLIKIRKRAGINAGTDQRYGLPATYTQEEMRQLIRNERRLELAYEEQRFWDIRRWNIAKEVMNKPLMGVKIIREFDADMKPVYTYEYVKVRDQVFEERMNFYPIPLGQLFGNPKLEQNPGWKN